MISLTFAKTGPLCTGAVSKLAMERADALALIGQIQAQEQCEVLISGADTSYLIPKHPDYVDHIRYFVGNHITRVKRAQDIPEDILKVSAYCRDGAASHAQTLGAPWKAAYSVAVAGEKWLDFTRADKGTGLAALCGELGVRPQEVIAFGDNFNDVPGPCGQPLYHARGRTRAAGAVPDAVCPGGGCVAKTCRGVALAIFLACLDIGIKKLRNT